MQVIFNASDFNHAMGMVSHAQTPRPTRAFQEGSSWKPGRMGCSLPARMGRSPSPPSCRRL